MRIEKFMLLNDLDKEESVFANGTFLGYYEEGKNMSDIYKLFNFYVELYYDIYKDERTIISASLYPELLPILAKIIALPEIEDPIAIIL